MILKERKGARASGRNRGKFTKANPFVNCNGCMRCVAQKTLIQESLVEALYKCRMHNAQAHASMEYVAES